MEPAYLYMTYTFTHKTTHMLGGSSQLVSSYSVPANRTKP